MNDPVDMVLFLKELERRPKAKAAIVLTHKYEGQKTWANELACRTGAEHMHLIDLFNQNPEICNKINQFSVQHLFEFLKGKSTAPVLIVSGMEFLKATWSSQYTAMEEFARRVQTWNTRPGLLFVLQHDKLLANYDFGSRYRQYVFLIEQNETEAL